MQCRYMGPGLTLAVRGSEAAVPASLIFCFDVALVFRGPMLMGLRLALDKAPQ